MEPLERQSQVLEAVGQVVAPLVRLLVHEGVGYQNLAALLKTVFLEQAQAHLRRQGERDTDSALSLRSGIHRKDIAQWRLNPRPGHKAQRPSLAGEVYAAWIRHPELNTPEGPLPLLRGGAHPSFESLAREVSQDVHPLTVLNELVRLGLARLDVNDQGQECVVLTGGGFVPQQQFEELLPLFVANLSAHLNTATDNLQGDRPRQLEQSAYAGGLTQASADELSRLARQLWQDMLKEFLVEAQRLHDLDEGRGPHTVRLGAYFNDEGPPPPPPRGAKR